LTERAAAARLKHGELRLFGTPRRLAVWVREVAERTEDLTSQVLGPPVRAAFDKDGKPTRAAEKFAEGHHTSLDKLSRVTTPKGEYLAAQVEEKGRAAQELLPEILHTALHGIAFRKSMRW